MYRIEKLAELCRNKRVFIQTHNFPDPDAIASAFGLQKLLGHYGIETVLCYEGRIDKLSASKMLQLFQIRMYSHESLQNHLRESDCIICVDSQKNAGNLTDFVGQEIAVIDHHPTFAEAEYLYKDIRITGACASLITEYFIEAGLTPDADTATALLYGIKMDTLQFSRGVTPLDISMFAFLHPLIDQAKMKNMESNNMEYRDLRAYGAAIEHIKVYDVAGFSFIPFSCPDALIATISDFILALEEVQVSVIFSRREDGIKFSVRSELADIHAGDLIHRTLQDLGSGGGHAGMAGGLIPEANVPLLGDHPEDNIIRMFLDQLDCIDCSKQL
jgi:nanoRNase/pAp phosphatase (c-di-AMP/oligoRNAs hydrolase)